jgi:hypothetical protein
MRAQMQWVHVCSACVRIAHTRRPGEGEEGRGREGAWVGAAIVHVSRRLTKKYGGDTVMSVSSRVSTL